MEWRAEGLIIGVRRHGESGVIVEAMVAGQGRHLGLVRGGRSPKKAATLQPGNTVDLTWRARLSEHLGNFSVELIRARAAGQMAERQRLYLLNVLCEHLRLLPERDPHDYLLALTIDLLDAPDMDLALAARLAHYEMYLLEELGYGLDLTQCALTGDTQDLAYVSPRTGRAATRAAGAQYAGRLLRLPAFLTDQEASAAKKDIADAFALTGHFLHLNVWHARGIEEPHMRAALIAGFAVNSGS